MVAGHFLQILHGGITGDAVVTHMSPVTLSLAAGLGHGDLRAPGDLTQNRIIGAVAGTDPEEFNRAGNLICAGIGPGAIAVADALSVFYVIGHVPVGRGLLQHRSLRAVHDAQPGLFQRHLGFADALNRIGAVEHIPVIAGDQQCMGQFAAVKHDAFGMIIQKSLQFLVRNAVDALVADLDGGISHSIGKAPQKAHAGQPCIGPQRVFRDLGPVVVSVQVHTGADHHGRGAKRAGTGNVLGQIQFIRPGRRLRCLGLRHISQQAHQNQSQTDDAFYCFFHSFSSNSEIKGQFLKKRHNFHSTMPLYSTVYIIATKNP